ncbi:MAG: hypothetical protein R3B04_08010 [Nitrospira sp.]
MKKPILHVKLGIEEALSTLKSTPASMTTRPSNEASSAERFIPEL